MCKDEYFEARVLRTLCNIEYVMASIDGRPGLSVADLQGRDHQVRMQGVSRSSWGKVCRMARTYHSVSN